MKIKDILEDYSIHPNIPVKHLANDIEKVIGQFKISLKVGICSPSQLIYSYCNYFDDIKKSFIRCVLNKEKSKSGIFVSQHKYGAQNEAYMSRSAEKWVRDLCFNELGVCG